MKITNIVILVLTTFLISCFPTYKNHLNLQYDFNGKYNTFLEEGEIEIYTVYHKMVSKNHEGKYILRTFYPEKKQMTSYLTFLSRQMIIKEGQSGTWADEGAPRSSGQYLNNKKEGEWQYFDGEEGHLSSKGNYLADQRNGQWIFYDNKLPYKKITYLNDKMEGAFIMYDSLSNIINEGIYKADTIYSQTTPIQTKGNSNKVYQVVEKMPIFGLECAHIKDEEIQRQCGNQKLLEFIYKNIKYPVVAKEYGVDGLSVVNFVIDTTGLITKVKVIRGICESIANESERVVRLMPKWTPGFQDGKPVEVQFNLPIKYKLE